MRDSTTVDRLETDATTAVDSARGDVAARRAVETYFRRWPMYLLLLLLCLLFGLLHLRAISRSFTSNGALFIQQRTLLESQVAAEYGSEFNRLPPSNYVSQELIGLLQTGEFMATVADTAGYGPSDSPLGERQLADFLRSSLVIQPLTENLVLIGATTEDPDESFDLATAVIESYIEFQVDATVAAGIIAENSSGDALERTRDGLAAARAEVDRYLSLVAGVDKLSISQADELDRLKFAEADAQGEFRRAVARTEDAQALRTRLETQARQQFAFVGQPNRPDVHDAAGLDGVLAVISFAVIGLVVSALAPAISAWRTRTVLVPDDLAGIAPAAPLTAVPLILRPGRNGHSIRTATETGAPLDGPRVGRAIEQMWIRAALQPSGRPRSVAVSSAIAGEGVTTISSALAASASTTGRTLLVDANLARPTIGVENGRGGLLAVLRGATTIEDAIEVTDRPGLDVLGAGRAGDDGPVRELSPALARELIEALSMRYHTVIIDCPALTSSPDALALANAGSACLLVVRHGVTDIDQVEAAIGDVADTALLGLVLNGYRSATPRWLLGKLGWSR